MESHWPKMYEDPYALKRIQKACELLKKHCKSGTVVEVGSFENKAFIYLEGYRYYPYDHEQFTPYTNIIDLNQPFELIPCDAILCLEVLEHLIKPHDVIINFLPSLSKEGVLIISLPNEATLFHRLRALFGTLDAECFSSCGKHLHLPSLNQSIKFLQRFGHIAEFSSYINPSATGSRQAQWFQWMKYIPDSWWQKLADWMPSLFARGWIFVLKPYPPKTRQDETQSVVFPD